MNWTNVGTKLLANGLPLLGGLLFGPGGAAIGGLIGGALGVDGNPDKVEQALRANPDAFVRLRELEMQHKENLERLYIEQEISAVKEVNQTLRAEIASDDSYVARMRPTFGYIVALSLIAQVAVGTYVVGWDPASMPYYTAYINALSIPTGVALGVLGVYVNGRTQEKKLDAGYVPQEGLITKIINSLGSK